MKKKIIAGAFIIVLLIAGFIAWKVFGSAVSAPAGKYFYIRTGESIEKVKENLVQQKIAGNSGWFNRVVNWLKYKSVKPGRYEIKKGWSLYKLVKMLRAGEQSPVKMVIIKERTKELFAGDVGEAKDEEVDIIKKGGNYGWPVMEGDSMYADKKIVSNAVYSPPINTYTHEDGICVIGGDFFYGDAVPLLKNKYVFADFNGNLFALAKNKQEAWTRQPLKVLNKPADPFLVFGFNTVENNELYVMGILNKEKGEEGVIYKIVQ